MSEPRPRFASTRLAVKALTPPVLWSAYLGWVVNRDELLDTAAGAGLELVREVLLPAWLSAEGAPESPIEHRGFLFASVS